MPLTTARCVALVDAHSRALADVARDHLDAPVEHCPGWDVAALVRHVTEVHWFWRTIAAGPLAEPPAEDARPAPPADEDLVATFLAGAVALCRTLADADQEAACWTWFPDRQDVGFITRHQVQEAAVHHWDAAHAAGLDVVVETDAAADAVEEFLTTSLADDDDATSRAPLDGVLVLAATDTGRSWRVTQREAGALVWDEGGEAPPTVAGTTSDLLLWLYGRVRLEEADPALVARFRAMSSTD